MGAALIGRRVRVEVAKTIATPLVVTGLSNANPGVLSYTGTDPVNGDVVRLADDFPVAELAGQVVRVSAVDGVANTFAIESIDTTSFGVYPVGTSSAATPVSVWSTLGIARTVTAGSTSPNKIDTTTLIDAKKTFVFGQPEDPEITVDVISQPLSEASQIIAKASKSNAIVPFRITFLQTGEKRLFAGYVTLPSESIPLGDVVTGSFSISQVGERLAFAS